MDPQDIRALQILEEIETGYSPSQRDLARKLNVSLGLVNSFMKRLAKKGYVKITTIPKKRVKYILTPQGFAEKSRLTYEFIQYSFRFYKKAMRSLVTLLEDLDKNGTTKIAFYGATDLAEIAFISLRATDMELVCVVDEEKKGDKLFGLTVKSLDEVRGPDFEKIIITTFDSKNEISHILQGNNIPREKIIFLD
jgi:DNA-binding MarR family transcriptional regulator